MQLRQLNYFLTVVGQRSVTRAASILRIAQPALSRQLQALEADMGVPLLVRHGWGVTPTAEGEILAAHARSILEEAQSARDAVRAQSDAPTGSLAIGVPSSLAAVVLPRLALAAQEQLPGVQLRLVEAYSANLHQRTLEGELDISILYSEPHLPMLTRWPLLTEPLMALAAPGVFAAGAKVTIPDLFSRPLLLPSPSNRLRVVVEEAAAKAGAERGVHMEVDSVPALLKLISAGVGYSILPSSTVREHSNGGQISVADFGPEPLTRSLVLARPSTRLETPAWRATTALLHTILKEDEAEFGWTVAQNHSWAAANL